MTIPSSTVPWLAPWRFVVGAGRNGAEYSVLVVAFLPAAAMLHDDSPRRM